ncbi:MAG: SRPBCC domain-containing protein [Dehalococcoidia bacterium]
MESVKSPLVMRRSIFIHASPERVWQEFESIDRMRRWYAGEVPGITQQVLRYEPVAGGWLEIACQWTKGTPGACRLGGKILVFDPGRELTQERHSFLPERPWREPIRMTFRLSPALGGTVVEVLEYGFEVAGEHAASYHLEAEAGWTMHELEALRRLVEAPVMTGASAWAAP